VCIAWGVPPAEGDSQNQGSSPTNKVHRSAPSPKDLEEREHRNGRGFAPQNIGNDFESPCLSTGLLLSSLDWWRDWRERKLGPLAAIRNVNEDPESGWRTLSLRRCK